MLTTQEDPSLKKEKKVDYSIAGIFSILIHLGIFILIGGTVIVERIIPKQTMIGDVAESIVEPTEEEMPVDAPQDSPLPADMEPQAEAAAATSNPYDASTVALETPSPTFSVNPVGVASDATGLPGAISSGGGSGSGSGSGKKAITLFGLKTESAKLGVILDCSGSGQPFLLAAFREIDKNFKDAPTVLACGCGMGTPKGVKVEVFGKMRVDRDKDKSGARNILGQLAAAEGKSRDLENYLNVMKERDNVYGIYGGDTVATNFGFEKLMNEGVDTIYWFSDLADKIDPKVMEKLIKDLQSRGIKVIVHNFSGNKIPDLPKRLAEETGGKTISKKP